MAKTQKEVAKVEATQEEPKSSKTAYVVVDANGNEQRAFTVSSHGKEAKGLAESFAKKFGFKVR